MSGGRSRESSRIQGRSARLALLAVSILLSLAIVELGLRLLPAYGGQAYSVNPTGSQYKFYRFDPELGWSNAPFMRGVYERDEFSFPIRVNAHGMRDAPVARSPGPRPRIAVLGDSFTWGIGVADEDRFTERLEVALDVEVLNFGVSGYSPVQYAAMIEDVLEFRPELVVVAFCLANDFGDNVYFERYGYYKPYAALDDAGELVIRGHPLPNVDDFGFRERPNGLLLPRIVSSAIRTRFLLPDQRGLLGFRDRWIYDRSALDDEQRERTERAIEINRRLLGRVRDAARRAGARLVLMAVPTKCEYSERCRNDGVDPVVRDAAHRVLEQTAARLDVRFVPTLDVLDGSHFWRDDGHWRPSGHERIARRLGEFLVEEGLLP